MATWHQLKAKTPLYHPTQWTVVIDPPNDLRWMYLASTRELAEVYMRNLKANNPQAYKFAFILKPVKRTEP
jgi:hypothetical protein